MVKEGLLDKYGRPNEKTPKDWLKKLYVNKVLKDYGCTIFTSFQKM